MENAVNLPKPIRMALAAVEDLRKIAEADVLAGAATFERYNFLVGLVAGYREAEAQIVAAGKEWADGERENDNDDGN